MNDRFALKPIRSPQGEAEKSPVKIAYTFRFNPVSSWCGRGFLLLGPLSLIAGEWATGLLLSTSPFSSGEEMNPQATLYEALESDTIGGLGAT